LHARFPYKCRGLKSREGVYAKTKRKGLGDILVEAGLISKEQLDKALKLQKKQAKNLEFCWFLKEL